jgi:hypothetical protein
MWYPGPAIGSKDFRMDIHGFALGHAAKTQQHCAERGVDLTFEEAYWMIVNILLEEEQNAKLAAE